MLNWDITAELTIKQTTKYIFTATFSEAKNLVTGERRIIATAEGGSPEVAFCRLLAELDKTKPDDPPDFGDYDWAKPDCIL